MNNQNSKIEEIPMEQVKQQVDNQPTARFGTILRSLGAALIITAAICFMLNQWNTDSHILRYFSFLGLTSIICALGLFLGLNIKEEKAARTLLGLAATMVPINFLQLGGLIYSRVIAELPTGGPNPSYESLIANRTITQWIAPDNWSVALALVVALPVLSVISGMAFKVFCRLRAKSLLTVFMLTNLSLLLPFRSPSVSICLACLMLLIVIEFLTRKLHSDATLKNREGELLQLMIPVPAILITLRTLTLYNSMIDSFFIGVILISIAIAMVRHFPKLSSNELTKESLQRFALPIFIIGWTLATRNIAGGFLTTAEQMLITFVPGALLTALIGRFCEKHVRKEALVFALLQLILSQALSYLVSGDSLSNVACLVSSVLGIILGTAMRASKTAKLSLIILALSLVLNIRSSMLFEMNPWISLGILGVTVILLSVVWEKYSDKVKDVISTLQNRFSYLD